MTFNLDDLPDDLDHDVAHAWELINEIDLLAEDVPERGEDFALSILEKAADIGCYIDEHNHVTKKQLAALENMLDGLRAWIRD